MNEKTEKYLQTLLEKLDEATIRVRESQGYNEETAYVHLLTELVREQVPNENFNSSASTAG
ncbi:MAG: hypothetical protein AB7O96_06620 [Pseudobdellovibrionaceae bacterium]